MQEKQLKYLFKASFENGTVIIQTPDDKSAIDPEKRSQFFDVLEYEKTSKLVAFLLTDGTSEWGVDLRDGHFEIQGYQFFMHEDPTLKDFRLVFFRRHTHSFNQGKEKDTELSHDIVYRFGWQVTREGENYQQVMQID